MGSVYGNQCSKLVKMKSPSGVSPLMMKYLGSSSSSNSSRNSKVDSFSPLSKMSSNSNSTSNSPLSAVFDEDDVLVMDGIPLNSSSPWINNNSDFYKTELCRSWEDLGKCRFGTRCQFAHGKEELRRSHFSIIKNKSEAQMCKSYNTGSSIYGSKCRSAHQVITDSALVLTTQTASPIKPHYTINTSITMDPTTSMDHWLPQDDGIEIALPSQPQKLSREKIDAYIDSVLYCLAGRRRLPVFAAICPE